MDIEKEREAFEAWHYEQYLLENPNIDISSAKYIYDYAHKNALVCQLKESHFLAWQAAKAQAVPETQQALNDRLLVKSIREHVESHIAEIRVNDLFDKGWLAAMKCIQNNIDMLEAQEPDND